MLDTSPEPFTRSVDSRGAIRASIAMARITGVAKDVAAATVLSEKGCDQGNARACLLAATASVKRRDMSSAQAYLTRACDLGDEQSCGFLKELRQELAQD